MADSDRQFGALTVLFGDNNARYPHANSLHIRGHDATAMIDPSLAVYERRDKWGGQVDSIVLSHVHEDHVAGVCVFPDAEVHAHREDAPGMRSLAGFAAMYGEDAVKPETADLLITHFHYAERPDTQDYEDGTVFDLGGTRIRAIHTPGHTRGHCVLLVEPDGVLFLGDIDLSSFGPYYGDACSNLDDFERSLARVREIDARVWVSSHRAAAITERATFAEKLDRFAGKFSERERAMLEFLREPHTIEEMVAHRFLYPPNATPPWVDAAERRTAEQQLARLMRGGQVERDGNAVYRARS